METWRIEKKKRKKQPQGNQRIFTKKYSDEQVDRLKRLIQNHHDRGHERFFAIKVDGEFCIYKTSDPSFFDDYKEMVDGTTENVEVIMYFGKSNNCNRHIFYLKEGTLGNPGNQDVDQKIKEALKRKDQEFLIQSLKEKTKRQEKKIEELEEELEALRSKTNLGGLLKEGMALFGAFRGHSPNSGTVLSGTEEAPAEVEVEIQEEAPSKESQNIEDEDEITVQRNMFDSIYHQFGEKGIRQVVSLMMVIAKSDHMRKKINELITEENERKEKEEPENRSKTTNQDDKL